MYPSWNGKKALLSFEQGEVYFDGIFTEPQLNHPECIIFGKSGEIFCGGEKGEIFRIDNKGKHIEQIATTNGFTLGLAIDREGMIYSCDLKHSSVYRINPLNGKVTLFANGINIPNYPLIDPSGDYLYVSDSHDSAKSGPGIWRYRLDSGEGGMWYKEPLRFANGMAFAADGSGIYVAETFAKRISFIPILSDGTPGERSTVVELDALPDGLALSEKGNLYICCYEPSLIYRYSDHAGLELLYYDPEAHTLCHPTNCAIKGSDLYTSNLGRWHISRIRGVE